MMRPSPGPPQEAAEPHRRAHEDGVVELVEVPLVQEEAVQHRVLGGEVPRRRLVDHVHVPGEAEAEGHHDRRQPRDQGRDVVDLLHDLVVGAEEQRALPEIPRMLADEGVMEQKARQERSGRQHAERDQHHERALVRAVIAVVPVLVIRMGGGLDVARALVVLDALVVARDVVTAMRPARLLLEGHEEQAPGIERRHEGRDDRRQEREGGAGPVRREGGLDDGVLRIVAGREREAGQRQRADRHHRRR